MERLPGNHDLREVGPVTLACMDADARNLMDKALTQYQEHFRGVRKMFPKKRPNVYSFAYWLFRWSGLIDPEGRAVKKP